MSKKTIAKFSAFVILAAGAGFLSACAFVASRPVSDVQISPYGPPRVVGTVELDDITESSGIAASRCQSNVLWTHNDSGDDAFLYAFSPAGANLGTFRVQNAENIDWEDIAAYKDRDGKCFLYIGEIGDNELKRREHAVYRIAEPLIAPAGAASDRKNPLATAPADIIRFVYPDKNHDAETLMVEPRTGQIYVLTKRENGPAAVFRLAPKFATTEVQKAEKVADLAIPAVPNGLVTGGDISPDGRRVIVCDYTRGYELALPEGTNNYDEIWRQRPQTIDIGKRKTGEAIGYSVDGTSIFVTSEKRRSPVIEVKRR